MSLAASDEVIIPGLIKKDRDAERRPAALDGIVVVLFWEGQPLFGGMSHHFLRILIFGEEESEQNHDDTESMQARVQNIIQSWRHSVVAS